MGCRSPRRMLLGWSPRKTTILTIVMTIGIVCILDTYVYSSIGTRQKPVVLLGYSPRETKQYVNERTDFPLERDGKGTANKKIFIRASVFTKPPKSPTETQFHRQDNKKIPNIVHYIVDETSNRYHVQHFLSIYSVVKFQKPVYIFLHCATLPFPSNWYLSALKIAPNIRLKKLKFPESINNITIGKRDNGIEKDFAKLLILQRYGGIIVDPDTLFTKSLDPLRNHEFVLEKQSSNLLSNHLMLSRKNATFLRGWIQCYESHTPNTTYVTYFSVDIVKNLRKQLNCSVHLTTIGAPQWWNIVNYVLNGTFDWSTYYCVNVFSQYFPFTVPTMEELLTLNTTYGQVARYVLYNSSGIIKHSIPNTLHFIWWQETTRDLSFVEYLSIKSAHHFGEFSQIYFHHKRKPEGQYWTEITEFPKFSLNRITDEYVSGRFGDYRQMILHRYGGTVSNFNIIYLRKLEYIIGGSYMTSIYPNNSVSSNIVISRPVKHSKKSSSRNDIRVAPSADNINNDITITFREPLLKCIGIGHRFECNITQSLQDWKNNFWIELDLDLPFEFNEKDILNTPGSFFDIARYVLYGESEIILDFKIPNIIHYIWFGLNKTFGFHNFIATYSASVIQKPDTIMFHYEGLPVGKWWDLLIHNVHNIVLNHVLPPDEVFQQPITVLEHKSDFVRIKILLEHGGIYLDNDIYVIRPLDIFRGYHMVMAEETPLALGNGFMMAAKNASFLRLYLDAYRDLRDSQWNHNSMFMPYLIMIDHRDLIHLAPSSRTLYPYWRTCGRQIWGKSGDYFWKDNYILHLYCKKDYFSDKTIYDNLHKIIYQDRFRNSTFGAITRWIFGMFQKKQSGSTLSGDTVGEFELIANMSQS